MLTPAQARDVIRSAIAPFGSETVPLSQACGRILHQDVKAERDQPPFDRVMMDGIALRFDALQKGRRQFRVMGTQQAGDPAQTLSDDAGCIEIMTGAVLPNGCDCVVPVERTTVDNGMAGIEAGYTASHRQFVHAQGSDHRRGDLVLRTGAEISPMDVAIIASCGLAEVCVAATPRVRVISTGNELVPAGSAIGPHQVRLSNGPAVLAMLEQRGYRRSAHDHLVDDAALLRERLAQILDEADILVLSGGVSMGKADFVPQVLADLGVEKVFHRISQQPGKPMWFGVGQRKQAVFALPGNPVSTLVCCRHYVLPALAEASGRPSGPGLYARLAEDVTYEPALTRFLPVRLSGSDDSTLLATPVTPNTSGDFTSLGGTSGYVELRQEQSFFPAGTSVPLHLWDRP